MNVDKINAFVDVIVSTFEATCNQAPFRVGEFEKLKGEIKNNNSLISSVSFSGSLTGIILLLFPRETAEKIYAAMMMEEAKSVPDDELKEGFSEIVNMIIGNVQASLADQNLTFDNQRVIIENSEVFNPHIDYPWLKIPMGFKDIGNFDLYLLCIET